MPRAASLSLPQRQKQAARDELTEVNKARESMRGALRSIKDKTKTTSLEQIDAKLREVHYKLTHETNTPSDEKKLHETMKALEQARPMAAEFGSLQQRLDGALGDACSAHLPFRLAWPLNFSMPCCDIYFTYFCRAGICSLLFERISCIH